MKVRSLVLLLALFGAVPAVAQDTAHVVVVATTDVHGHVTAWDYVHDRPAPWGLTRAATVVDSLRAQYPGEVVVVDAGDLIQGNPFAAYYATQARVQPYPVIDALNGIGYDAVTPGNHEFNFGLGVLARAESSAVFPFVSANIYALPGDTLAYPPYVIVRRDSVRIGITGFTTPGVMVWDRNHVAGRIVVRRIADVAEHAIEAVRAAGADLTIVLSHSGMDEPSSYDTTGVGPENDAWMLATLADRPDLVVVGHTHESMRDSVLNGVHFVQPNPWARAVSVVHVDLVRGAPRERWRVVGIHADLVPLDSVPPSPRLVRRLAAWHETVRTWVNSPLAVANGDWSARYGRAGDTPLVEFINAVQRRVTGAQLSATAVFNTNVALGPGAVRMRDVAGVYPYENTLRAVRIDGAKLKAYLEQSARYFNRYVPGAPIINDSVPGFNFDIVSGVQYAIDLTQPVGSRIVQLTYDGRLVLPTDTFTLALNSYRQVGGGGFTMLEGLPVVYDHGESVRDVLTDAIRQAGTLDASRYPANGWRIIPPDAAQAVHAAFAPPEAARDSILLRVLTTNDLHGALEPTSPEWAKGQKIGGAAALAAWMDTLAARCGCTSIRLDAGDEFQGTPISNFTFGRSVVATLDRIHIDAAAVGNHDFDWGIDTLKARIAESTYPWLSANLTRDDGVVPPWVHPWTLLQRGGLKIAVIGVTTTSTPTTTNPRNVRALRFANDAEAVRAVLPEVRQLDPDYVIVLAHAGAFCDSTCHGEVIDLARGLDSASVDLIVSGHTHSLLETTVNGIPIIQAYSHGTDIGIADFVRTASGAHTVHLHIQEVDDTDVTADTAIAALVKRYATSTEREIHRPVATLQFAMARHEGEQYPLGYLIADAYRNAARADFGLINNGGIRADLPGGTVTFGDVYLVQPFNNSIVRVSLTGVQLRAVLEHVVAHGTPSAHLSGLIAQYDPRRPVGRRIRDVRMPDGSRIDPKRTYTIAVPDFLADGGSGYKMLVGLPRTEAGVNDVDAVVDYLRRLPQPVDVSSAPRLIVQK